MNQYLLKLQDFVDACQANGVPVDHTKSQTVLIGDIAYQCINVELKCMGEFGNWLRANHPERVWLHSLNSTTNPLDWTTVYRIRFAFVPENPLRIALRRIAAIQDQMQGGDWEEIELARNIANAALEGRPLPEPSEIESQEEEE